MKHVSYADKTLFLDDETADALVEYAGMLATAQTGDSVTVTAIDQDGNEVEASLVLNSATNLVVESTNSAVQTPLNEEVAAYMREKSRHIKSPPQARPLAAPDLQNIDLELDHIVDGFDR